MTTVAEIAAKLDGIEYPPDIDKAISAEAKAARIVICYGQSDDLVEFEGAIYDELGANDYATFMVDDQGLVVRNSESTDEEIWAYVERGRKASQIRARWCPEDSSLCWSFETDIPHATFDIREDGTTFCRGIVFSLDALA